ncbi:MAG TPA: M14 metallopeptidase family protein [Bacteroidales bacterium]|nr:M14 metallopeptidase family protein [Bacteroidales bacterium]
MKHKSGFSDVTLKSILSGFTISILMIFTGVMHCSNTYGQTGITSPMEHFGYNIGDDYLLISYTQALEYWKKLESESPRMILEDLGPTSEGRDQFMAIITSPENHVKLDYYKEISRKLALAKDLTEEQAKELSNEGKAVVWIDGGLHATEVVGSQQLMELVYQMVSNNDPETLRFLDDIILLAVFANPDGLELVSGWYMRTENPGDRSTGGLPRLYQKYVGHDNNRDSYMASQPETENMARIMYREWYPQIMYNHHQTGPSGLIVFVPPFRDPPNYNYNPLLISSIQSVGLAMHNRLIAEGKPGSGMRSAANYSIWFNGNLRTTGYFHNQIGILTEIKGNPTPIELDFRPDRLLPTNDVPFPVTPDTFFFRNAIDYSITLDKAALDYASRYRETVLYNRYLMGRNNIEKGSRDSWTIHPKIVDMVNQAVLDDTRNSSEQPPDIGRRRGGVSMSYMELFRIPENRDPRAFILPSDQADFPTAVKFVNTFIKNGITVHHATSDFQVNGKTYPEGSIVFKTDQAFRPHILDMFEPQDHPDDFLYEGGPPLPPYDNAGYTLSFQMGVEFDRILDPVDGPFEEIVGFAKPMAGMVSNSQNATGFLLSHSVNDAVIAVNRLLAKKESVYWLTEKVTANNKTYPEGTIYIPANGSTINIINAAASELGLNFDGIISKPASSALLLNPVKVGLWDRYGGSMPAGWTRWLLEQFEFPFETVYPKTLDNDDLIKKFDVLVFVTGAIPQGQSRMASFGGGRGEPDIESIPEEYHDWLGQVTTEETVPRLLEFLRNGGTILAIGSSTSLAQHASLPMGNHIVDGGGKPLSNERYYIPGSILEVRVDNTLPLAYGFNDRVDIFFDNSPVFRLHPEADKNGITTVAWFDSDKPLRSGWAWGQDRLYGGVAIAEAKVGEGNLYLFGPEILFRAQPHGTFKFFFNGIFLGGAKEVQSVR